MRFLTRLALAAIALLLTACTSDAVSDAAVTSTGVDQKGSLRRRTVRPPATADVVAVSRGTSVPTSARVAVRVADQLQLYLARVLGGPSSRAAWHGHIRRVTVGLHTATIQTDLSSDEDDRATAEQICLVVSWFRLSPEGRHVTSLDVEVYGQQGALIAAYDDVSDRTSANASGWMQRATSSKLLAADYQPPPTPTSRPSVEGRRES